MWHSIQTINQQPLIESTSSDSFNSSTRIWTVSYKYYCIQHNKLLELFSLLYKYKLLANKAVIRYSKEDQIHYKSGCKDIDKGALLIDDIATEVLSYLYLLHSWVDHVEYEGCTKSIWHLFS